MKLQFLHFVPKADVCFTEDEYDLMLACSEGHYDGVCRDAGCESVLYENGRPGFLRSASWASHSTGGAPVAFTFRQLDTLAKILEVGRYLDLTPIPPLGIVKPFTSRAEMATSLGFAIRQTLKTLNECTPPRRTFE